MHSFQQHGGSSVFIDLFKGNLIFNEQRRVNSHEDLFMDQYGELFEKHEEDYLEFNKFKMDTDLVDSVEKDYFNFKIADRIIVKVLKSGTMLRDLSE
jgi:hypothetical protein